MVVFKPLEHLTNGALVDVVNVTSYQRIEVRGIGMHPYNTDGVAVFFGEKNVLFIFPMAGVRVVHDDIDFVIEDGVDELVETVLMCITNPRLLKASDHVHKKRRSRRSKSPHHGGVSLHTSIYLNLANLVTL